MALYISIILFLGLPKEGSQFTLKDGVLGSKNNDWKKVEGGDHHAILLDQNGTVYTLGRKEYGRLGLADEDACTDAQEVRKKLVIS